MKRLPYNSEVRERIKEYNELLKRKKKEPIVSDTQECEILVLIARIQELKWVIGEK